MGVPEVVVHNAVGGAFGSFREISAETLATNFQVNTMALFHLAQRLTPAMVERGTGALIVTGNTSALRGRAQFAGFAPTKAAQRILAESIARDLARKVFTSPISSSMRLSTSPGPAKDFLRRPTTSSSSRVQSLTRSGTWFARIGRLGRSTSRSVLTEKRGDGPGARHYGTRRP
jgi:NAD(P)-dependent dehydrogenase (short-subunit alcohol dehydrogenase family)